MERSRTRLIHDFILDRVSGDGAGVAGEVAQAYGISRQAANRHLDELVGHGVLVEGGSTRAKYYELRRTSGLTREFRITPVLNPDRVWDDHIAEIVAEERDAIRSLCRGAFAELVQNAASHERASWLSLSFSTTARHIDLSVSDDGKGTFATLGETLGVNGPREAAEELARRARTCAVDHPAVRLLLLARNFEAFAIRSSGIELRFDPGSNTWSVRDADAALGTTITLRCRRESRGTSRTRVPLHPRSTHRSRRARPEGRTIRS